MAVKVPVWLDCDPGTDDAFAILLLLFHPKFELLGISTVHGNAPLKSTTHNALGLLEVLKVYDVPVYKGESRPLVKESEFALEIHGESGLGGADLPETTRLQPKTDKTYLEAMRDVILQYPNEISLIATGAFTNVSILFETYPDLKQKVKYIPIMGCGFGLGNFTKHAEFNVYIDPKAANNLFHDEILMNKIIVNGLNITHTAVADKKIRYKLFEQKPAKNIVRTMYKHILEFYFDLLYSGQGFDGPPLHDPLAVFTLLPMVSNDKDYKFEWFRKKVHATEGGDNDGESVFVDGSSFEEEKNEETGSIIAKSVDVDLFFDYLATALDNAEEHVESALAESVQN